MPKGYVDGVAHHTPTLFEQAASLTISEMRACWHTYALLLIRADAEQFLSPALLEEAIRAHKRVAGMIEFHVALTEREKEDN